MLPVCGILSGAEHIEIGTRKILNLWTETEEFHLGHLHLVNTAHRLVKAGHEVGFYVGEFQSDLWPIREFRRREQGYRVACRILEALAEGARTEFGYHASDNATVVQGRALHNKVSLGLQTGTLEDPPAEPIKADLLRIYRKTWGGNDSPFLALFSLYAKERGIDTLLIADRHAYIGRALAWFANRWLGSEIQVVVVRNVLALNGEPMSGAAKAVRMQEPTEYLRRSLELEGDAGKRQTFIRQFCELFLESTRTPHEFDEWWKENSASLDVPAKFECFVVRAEALFEEYRTVVYGVLPDTRDETSQRINNEALLGYTGLVVKRWNGENGSLPEWARSVDPRVNDNADEFEKAYYDAAFGAVTAKLSAFENASLGLARPVVDKLVELASENRTTDLFLFFGAKKTHRDHYVHTFNVAGLGQFFLDLHVSRGKQLKQYVADNLSCSALDVEMTWWLTAMLHDHAYPLYSMMQWLARLHPLAKAYPDKKSTLADLATPHLESLPLVHDDIKKPMLEAIQSGDFGLRRLWEATKTKRRDLFWFLDPKDLDPLCTKPAVDHAFAAVLNIAFHLQPWSADIRTRTLMRQLLRGILFHTQVPLADGKVSDIHWRVDPMAYLLLVCDELQEWSRRTLREKEGVMRSASSELLLSPLHRRLDSEEGWQLPREGVLDATVRYFKHEELRGWDSHAFHESKSEMFQRLRTEDGDQIPRIRLQYALATPTFPAT